MKEFYIDKKREESSIKDSIRLMTKKGFTFIKDNNDNKYDLEFQKDGKNIFVEVKQDFSCFKTGNIGVEYSCRGKLSGILVSEANYYIYKIHQNHLFTKKVINIEPENPKEISIILIDKNKLKSCIEQILEQTKTESEYLREFLHSPKKNFYIRKIKNEVTNEFYDVSVRLINGGDIGSNSLNVLFDRYSFIENFTFEYLETRNRTEQENKDLKSTLENSKKRDNIRYSK